ncbi:hypothetical protein K439DRAFT_1621167 [Ramaria rubella]|nr:hypothetical protein K439DRAFT_1621167 [Ramaria rubella]
MNANSKLPDDKDRQLQNHMLKTYTAIGVAAMKLAPESVQHAAQLKADLVNSPLIVQDDNFYHRESQSNMSQAQMYDGHLTITDLGPSGDRHNDNNNEESGYSNALVHSYLLAEYHPDLFMFYELGLRYHGGTPPTAPPGVTPPAWNTRILIIQYPARHLMNMSARQSLAALPGGAILYVTPEMQEHHVPKKKYQLWSTRATYVTDGYDLMSQKAHTTFVARLLLQLCHHTLRGMPNNVKICLNMFLSSIKYQDENGDMYSIELWRFGELIANMSAKEQKEYSEAWDIVDRHLASTHIFIPHVAQNKEAHIQDKTFCRLARYKGPSFKYDFKCPRNHEGFNDDSDDEDEEPDIFGNKDINEHSSNAKGKNTKRKKGKQGRKGSWKRKNVSRTKVVLLQFQVEKIEKRVVTP